MAERKFKYPQTKINPYRLTFWFLNSIPVIFVIAGLVILSFIFGVEPILYTLGILAGALIIIAYLAESGKWIQEMDRKADKWEQERNNESLKDC
jgi:uncharacterized membrane protein YjdF